MPENIDYDGPSEVAILDSSARSCLATSADSADQEWADLAPLHEVTPLHDATIVAEPDENRRLRILEKWRKAARRAIRHMHDPWRKYNIHETPVLHARRFRYSAIRKTWTEDIVEIKMCMEPFARGAMRECFRLKKLSTLDRNQDWSHAHNYVAKRYIQEVEKQVVFDDVKLQMDCKLWAEEFNRHNPPKKIDIVQMCVLQMIDLPGEPYYHLEHFIEGEYIKYNSNSGFVSEVQRKTPQAFTHFTFERSGHQMIVVDIQGVGDLYTDPQIHTVNGTDYGDGNLGTRGMALFFHSHLCNDICHMLCLTEYDLSQSERRDIEDGARHAPINDAATRFVRNRSSNSSCSALVTDLTSEDAMECLRIRSQTYRSRSSSTTQSSHTQDHDDDCMCDACMEQIRSEVVIMADDDDEDDVDIASEPPQIPAPVRKNGRATLSVESFERRRRTTDSMCSSMGSSSRLTGRTENDEYWARERKKSVPAGIITALQMQLCHEAAHEPRHITILGQIHLDLARYHETGRFLREEANDEKKRVLEGLADSASGISDGSGTSPVHYDREAALFHLDVARRCGNLEAILTVAQMTYGLQHELLKDIGDDVRWFADSEEDAHHDKEKFAFELMLTAAEMGDRDAILWVAECYETGRHMGNEGTVSYPDAIFWLERSMGFADEEEGTQQYKPRHELLATIAGLYQEGGYGLKQNLERAYQLYTEAAEAAMECMKGKLANKYYEYAEICAG